MTRHWHDTCGVGDGCLGRGAVVRVLCGAGSKRKIRGLGVAPATLGMSRVMPAIAGQAQVPI
jgi:hypothetical protein